MTPAETKLLPCRACEDAATLCDKAAKISCGNEEYDIVAQGVCKHLATGIRSSCRHTALTPARDEGVTVPKSLLEEFRSGIYQLEYDGRSVDCCLGCGASEDTSGIVRHRESCPHERVKAMLAAPQPEGRG